MSEMDAESIALTLKGNDDEALIISQCAGVAQDAMRRATKGALKAQNRDEEALCITAVKTARQIRDGIMDLQRPTLNSGGAT